MRQSDFHNQNTHNPMSNVSSGRGPIQSSQRGPEPIQNENQFRSSQFNPTMNGSGYKP